MMLESYNLVMQRVEQMVCKCVSTVMTDMNREPILWEDVYDGITNIPLGRIVARNVILDILHNKYGFSYSVLAQRANMTPSSVMRCVRKCHMFMLYDNVYKSVIAKAENEIKNWYEC